MYLNSRIFWFLVLLSIVLIIIYQWGIKKNISLSRKISKILEDGLGAKDAQYTWLGGVLGFSARYLVDGFKKVEAILRLFPRHSLLYWPFALLLGRRDNLRLLFYLKDKASISNKGLLNEFHLIEKGYSSYINNKLNEFRTRDIQLNNKAFILFYKKTIPKFLSTKLCSNDYFSSIRHIAYTPDKAILYFEFIGIKEDILKNFLSKLDLFYNING